VHSKNYCGAGRPPAYINMPDTLVSPPAADPLAALLARWRATVESELKGAPFDKKLVTRTFEGLALQPLYSRADLAGLRDLGATPGAAPFLRGARPQGYRTGTWDVAQELPMSTPADFNATLRADLMLGQNAVVLTPDAASRLGRDADEVELTMVGEAGVSLSDIADVKAALDQIDLAAVPVYCTTGADPTPLAAIYLAAARERGVDWTALRGTLSADPIGEWSERGQLPCDIEALYCALAGWTNWASAYVPGVRTVGVNLAPWSDAGATAAQELAFALAAATEYFRALDRRGVKPETAAARMCFRFAIGPQFFTEIAKFRAFRPLFTRVATAFGAPPEAAGRVWVQTRTARSDKTMLDPHVNMLRVTTEALSAVLGGCDALHIAPYDEVAGATTEFSRRIARNVHTLLAEEFNLATPADPAGGSWYVEHLTDALARTAWKLFQDIEARGGFVAALRIGYVQELVAKAAAEKLDAAAKRRTGIVGTNLFPNLKEKPLAATPVIGSEQQAGLARAIRARRGVEIPPLDATDWPARFRSALAAARDGATVGQLSRLSRGAAADASPVIQRAEPRRIAEQFEALRAASAAFAARTGARPKVFLAKMGPALQHKARADFSAGFFAVGGFEVVAKQAFETPESAAAAAVASGAKVAVLCSTDETYAALVPAFSAALKAARPEAILVLAGLPADPAVVASYRAAGVDEFIHIRASVHDVLAKLLKQIGALA
jgi:methylmalonyl-CoA mutase